MIIKQRIQRTDGSIQYREYLKQQRLGKGGFAECFVAERTCDKKKYALKIISKKLLEKPKARQKMLSQIKLHSRAKHKNICDLERAFEDDENVYMLLELCSNGNMFELLRKRKKLTIPETQFFILQLIDALCYLHNKNMIHRDVKLGNLLIDSNMNLKLADFGLTTKLQFKGDLKHTVCGTPNYIAPEIIRSSMGLGASGHSYQVDVWSTGVIMYLMLIGKAPFQTTVVEQTYKRISKGQFQFPDSFKDNDAKDLLKHILVVDPSKRYTFQQILQHPFMNPKEGIPRQLQTVSLTQIPKFGIFQKYAQDAIKKSARDASVVSIRSSIDLSIDADFDGPETQKQNLPTNGTDTKKKILSSIFTTSSLSKSLQKLADLSRTSSPQSKNVKGLQGITTQRLTTSNSQSRLNLSANRLNHVSSTNTLRNSRVDSQRQQMQINNKKKQLSYVYILQYRHQTVWNYRLSNGYVGTYEAQYKLLYNKCDNKYFSIEKDTIKELKRSDQATDEKFSTRKKFLKNYNVAALQCEPYINKQRLIYLIKIYKVDNQGIILFRLSNGRIHAHDFKKNLNLLITETDILLIEIENGRQLSRIMQNKDRCERCPARMVDLYLQVKKIMQRINQKKQG